MGQLKEIAGVFPAKNSHNKLISIAKTHLHTYVMPVQAQTPISSAMKHSTNGLQMTRTNRHF